MKACRHVRRAPDEWSVSAAVVRISFVRETAILLQRNQS